MNWIDGDLASALQRMVGYRNIAVHEYQTLQLPITVAVITRHLVEFEDYAMAMMLGDAQTEGGASN